MEKEKATEKRILRVALRHHGKRIEAGAEIDLTADEATYYDGRGYTMTAAEAKRIEKSKAEAVVARERVGEATTAAEQAELAAQDSERKVARAGSVRGGLTDRQGAVEANAKGKG